MRLEHLKTLQDATKALAGVCDGAVTRDDQGFNGGDAYFGHSIAMKPNWTPKMARAAWRMLQKYRNQLAGYGIDISNIPEPSIDEPVTTTASGDFSWFVRPPEKKRILAVGDVFQVFFAYDESLVDAVKKLPGRRWDKEAKSWTVPAIVNNVAPLTEFATKYGFELSESVTTKVEALLKIQKANIEGSKAADASVEVEGLGGELRPFQKAGVAYAARNRRTFIADEMGLGKTVETLATAQHIKAFPFLVIAPSSLLINWKREAEKWLPGKKVLILGSKTTDEYADVLIVSYGMVKHHRVNLINRRLEGVAFDESHFLKNYKAQRTMFVTECVDGALYGRVDGQGRRIPPGVEGKGKLNRKDRDKIGRAIPNRYALTGTPVLNRPNELLTQLTLLGQIDEFGGFWGFSQRYCGAYRGKHGLDMSGAANLDELNEKLRATCYIRRLKSEVLKELPAKQRALIPLEIDNRKEYDRAERELISYLREQAARDEEFIKSIAHLPPAEQKRAVQARADHAEEKARRAQHLVRIEALKQLAVKGKMEGIKEWVNSFLETGEKLVLFAWHQEVVEALAKEFNADFIHGGTPKARRMEIVDRFQNDPQSNLVVLNIQTGGVGLTLTAASNVAFVEQGWNPAVHDQGEDRCHRIGQEDQVTAWYLLGVETIDEDIADLIAQKRTVVDATTEGGQGDDDKVSVLNELIDRLKTKGTK